MGFAGSEGLYLPMSGNSENGKALDEGDLHVMGAPQEPSPANMNQSCWTSPWEPGPVIQSGQVEKCAGMSLQGPHSGLVMQSPKTQADFTAVLKQLPNMLLGTEGPGGKGRLRWARTVEKEGPRKVYKFHIENEETSKDSSLFSKGQPSKAKCQHPCHAPVRYLCAPPPPRRSRKRNRNKLPVSPDRHPCLAPWSTSYHGRNSNELLPLSETRPQCPPDSTGQHRLIRMQMEKRMRGEGSHGVTSFPLSP